jgi:transcriptional regulator GlxA family with amidase domain
VERLLADPDAATAPLVIGPAARLLAATALSVFPNTLLAGPACEEHHDARPETVRRAVSFIEANAAGDITVADIAAAAYVTTRAVQLAFRRHLDTTPLAYLRRVRLELAHEDLRQAAPGGPVSVTAVAFRWGFASSSRFADQYRAAYGELPSTTLHS